MRQPAPFLPRRAPGDVGDRSARAVPGFLLDVDSIRAALQRRYPALHLLEEVGHLVLRGSVTVESDGVELDWFAVAIDLEPLERGDLPIVRETGGRIPWTAERHVNPDGTACVCLPEDYFLRHPGPFDLSSYLDGPIRSLFIGQALVERGEAWPFGEWAHGDAGGTEWMQAFAKELPPERLKAYVDVLKLKALKGHIACPCGSGRRIRDCHFALLRRLRGLR